MVRELKGHAHWVNSLTLSTEFALKTGPFDEEKKEFSTSKEAQKYALDRYYKLKGTGPERLVSGSDDFTMFLWQPSKEKKSIARMTGHSQLINHVAFSPDGLLIASGSFDKSIKLWDGKTGAFFKSFLGHIARVY